VGASFRTAPAAIYLRARGVEGMGLAMLKLMAHDRRVPGHQLTVLTIFALRWRVRCWE